MRDEVQRDLTQSSVAFVRIVWPFIRHHCPELRGSVLRLVEGRAHNPVAQDLDTCAGIDAFERAGLGIRGIAARVQWKKDYHTFTIRVSRPTGNSTEYAKRLATIKRRHEGFLYPYWTIQAYVEKPGGALLAVAVAKTAELYQYIEQREQSALPCPRHPAGNSGEWFLSVEWQDYRQSGQYLFVASQFLSSPSGI